MSYRQRSPVHKYGVCKFCQGIWLPTHNVIPLLPRGNGRAEAAVKVVKGFLAKSESLPLSMLNYRNTPPQGHTYSPAQRMFSRRTRLPLPTSPQALSSTFVKRDLVVQELACKRANSKVQYDKHAGPDHSELAIGDFAYVKPPPTKHGQPWSYGTVIDQPGPRSYKIATQKGIVRRNRVHLRPAAPPARASMSSPTCSMPMSRGPQPVGLPSYPQPSPGQIEPLPTSTTEVASSPIRPITQAANSAPEDVQPLPTSPEPYVTRSGRTVKPRALMNL